VDVQFLPNGGRGVTHFIDWLSQDFFGYTNKMFGPAADLVAALDVDLAAVWQHFAGR
jgi:hypothetical protein